jgi:hypothetical protein
MNEASTNRTLAKPFNFLRQSANNSLDSNSAFNSSRLVVGLDDKKYVERA